MEDSGKHRFHGLEHDSKMRLFTTYSHTSTLRGFEASRKMLQQKTSNEERKAGKRVQNTQGFWVLSNAARKASLAQEEAIRAHTEALATAEAARAKAATSHAAAERRTRAEAEERSRVMRDWEEGDRARAAEMAVAARKSQQHILRLVRLPGECHNTGIHVPFT